MEPRRKRWAFPGRGNSGYLVSIQHWGDEVAVPIGPADGLAVLKRLRWGPINSGYRLIGGRSSARVR